MPSQHSDKKFIKLPGIEFSRVTPQQADAARAARAELQAQKKNEELERQPKAIEQKQPEPAPVANKEPEPAHAAQKKPEPAHAAQEKPVRRDVPSAGGSGEVMFGSKDPKATAVTLKAAIEAMNAGSGGYPKKPAAKEPVKKQAP